MLSTFTVHNTMAFSQFDVESMGNERHIAIIMTANIQITVKNEDDSQTVSFCYWFQESHISRLIHCARTPQPILFLTKNKSTHAQQEQRREKWKKRRSK